ncbi:conserved hypothetical protein [Candidatus Desulfarcum epimagneticum]|uniref:Class I SAM-dependent methyltransferase n=1 Tax=uncultured Desulfobacteraceae bacterium TaxID=218296 RepID=A0A484HLJ7_9BACT|nr:conserved hypothetical protein [uncultured Desulfobacteraceae bacterium]
MKFHKSDLDEIPGFLDPEEARRLYDTALEAAGMGAPCLEVGGYCGKSAMCLGLACKEKGGVLFSIDHHRGSEEQQPGEEYFDPALFDPVSFCVNTLPCFLDTLKRFGLQDTVIPIVAESAAVGRMWGTGLSLVFIDGGHSREAALKDYAAWSGHVIPGGYLLIHDLFPDPEKGGQAPMEIYRMALSSGLFEALPMTRTLGVLKRKG